MKIKVLNILLSVLFCPFFSHAVPGADSLLAGVYRVDITPSLSIPLGGYSTREGPATGVRDPLNATVIVFDNGHTRVALVSLDLIQVRSREGHQIYRSIQKQTGIEPGHVLINASHTHGSPWLETDSCYSREVADKVGGAVHAALLHMEPVTIGYGEGEVSFNVNRRSIGGDGKSTGGLDPSGLTDPRVKVLRIDSEVPATSPLAVMFQLSCHPNVLRGENTLVTSDFPGEAKRFIEHNFGATTTALFFQGCAGDIRANLPGKGNQYRSGNAADMLWCGWSSGAEVVKTATWLGIREQISQRRQDTKIRTASGDIMVSARESGEEVLWPREHIVEGKARLPVKLISIGDICFVALPGEPVVAYGLKIEKKLEGLGFKHIIVLGYSDGDAGYIPTNEMYLEGGYEVSESSLAPSCEEEMMAGIMSLAWELVRAKK